MKRRNVIASVSEAIFSVLCCALTCAACTSASIFTPIGTNMANPLTVAVDSTAKRAYVMNANDKVLYTTGSVHVVDLSTITSPTRVNSTTIDGFTGQLLLDTTNKVLYTPNRLSANDDVVVDAMQRINVDETSTSFLSLSAVDANGNPFGIGFDRSVAPVTQIVAPSREGILDVFNISSGAASRTAQINLKQALDSGTTPTTVDASEAVVIGAQAFVTRATGGLLGVNLNEATSTTANPVDYEIDDIQSPRGIATDGTSLFVVSVETDGSTKTNYLYVLNLVTLTADSSNTTTAVKHKDNGFVVRRVAVGGNPEEVLMNGTTAYVTNFDDSTVSVIDTTTGTVTATITVGSEPFGMAFYQQVAGTNSHLLVCNHASNTVSIIALASNAIVATYP